MNDYYGYTDIILKYLNEEIRERYSKLKGLLDIDEINVLNSVKDISEDVYALIRRTFLVMARYYYKRYFRGTTYNINFYKAMTTGEGLSRQDLDLISLDEEWIDELLENVDELSKVSFKNEFERRRGSLFEALLVSPNRANEVEAFLKRLTLLLNTYGIETTDKAVLKAYEDKEVLKIRWRAELDDKTCTICKERNGQLYDIREIPPKPHFGCRCWYEAVMVKE